MTTKAVYPGSFDPITNGHIDIIQRAKEKFDVIYVTISDNSLKNPFFSADERVSLVQDVVGQDDRIIVKKCKGLIIDFCLEHQIDTIIRGLRAVSDFEFEFQLALTNRTINDQIDTIFLMTDAKYSFLSSSLVKELANFGGDVTPFVAKQVKKALDKRRQHE
ncbi:MAG: pantetheine-phosphate adenylyltransferase [Actinobacteria bacterium]|nr:pantetheine-phosphate adenylyltransferase [Actinomycetota bacterium]|tara:strand:+ start:1376 stop:1861 length:486 start_codon:yes stop_codon:yes gene_type:complete